MNGNGHFDWEQVLDRMEGRTPAEPSFWGHLEECQTCALVRAEAEALRDAIFLAGAPDPSAALMSRTWGVITKDVAARRVRQVIDGIRGLVSEIWATLTADSLLPSAAVRGADTATPRLLVYETPDYSVSLSFAPASVRGRFDVLGNVVPKNAPELPAGGRVVVSSRPESLAVSVSEFGEFRCPDLEMVDGVSLVLDFPEARIHLGPLPAVRDE